MADLNAVAASNLDKALASEAGKSADIVAHDGVLRQTVIALRKGTRLGAHNSPPAASLQVLVGKVRVEIGERQQGEFAAGEIWVLTHERHSVLALEDAVFLLTTVTSTGKGLHS